MNIENIQLGKEICKDFTSRQAHAVQTLENLPVIVKYIPNCDISSEKYRQFRNDYTASLNLSLHNSDILKPLDFVYSDTQAYIVYESFDGISLSDLIETINLSITERLKLSLNIVEALGYIHQSEIIHCNLTPFNILVNPSDFSVKLTGLYFAQYRYDDNRLNNFIDCEGIRLAYISPEQTGRLNTQVDYRSDFYSLGVIMYQIFSGGLPFKSNDPLEIIHGHIARQPKPIDEYGFTQCPFQLSKIILKLLEKMVVNRYQSISGIKQDLKNCLSQLIEKNTVIPFELASYDFSTLFTLPGGLYGRKSELSKIARQLEKTNKESVCFFNICGHAGIGKSALINEALQQSKKNLLYFSGKYGQYDKNIPFNAFVQVIEKIIDFLLGESEKSFNVYRKKIIDKLGINTGIITELVPAMEAIVGKQEKPLALGIAETKNRLQSVISSFFSIIAQSERPLIIILDDLQWSDSGSVDMLQYLFDNRGAIGNILIVSICRDDEVQRNSGFEHFLKNIGLLHGYEAVRVEKLKPEDVTQILVDTLHTSPGSLQQLSNYIYQTSDGNPLYIKQLLSKLYRENVIWADTEKQVWRWDVKSPVFNVQLKSFSDIIQGKLKQLSERQMITLQHGLFLGSFFTIQDLALVMSLTEDQVLRLISPLVTMDILVSHGDAYRFKQDRTQQAVAELLSDKNKEKIHHTIGHQLLKCLPEARKKAYCLEITNHLNLALALITEEDDLEGLLDLNCQSALMALNNSSYQIALLYSEMAKKIFETVKVEVQKKYQFDVLITLARCQYLNAQYQYSKQTLNDCFSISNTLQKKCITYAIYKDVIVSGGKNFDEAANCGVDILIQAGMDVSQTMSELNQQNVSLRERIIQQLHGRKPEKLLDSGEIQDSGKRQMLGLLAGVWEAAYYNANEPLMSYTTLISVSISIEYGNCSESAFGYVLYGMLLTQTGEYQQGYNFGELAITLNKFYDDRVMLPKISNLFCNYISFHIKPFCFSADLYERSSAIGQQNGDYLFGLWASFFVLWSDFLCGKSLKKISEKSDKLRRFIEQTHDTKMIYAYETLNSVINALYSNDLQSKVSSEYIKHLDYWQENNFIPAIAWQAILLGQYYCFSGDFTKAYELLDQKDLMVTSGIVMFPHSQYGFYHVLALLKLLNNKQLKVTSERTSIIEKTLKQISHWASLCPQNFLYQQLLLQAEKYRLDGSFWEASNMYDQCISSAKQNDLVQIVALAQELAADFWASNNNQQLAEYFSKSSVKSYTRWGAFSKAKKATTFLGRGVSSELQTGNDTIASITNQSDSNLDISSIFNFTQEISGEINRERLLETTMKIFIENAGADRGVLIEVKNEQLFVVKVAEFRNYNKVTDVGGKLEAFKAIPSRVIHYVERTEKKLLLKDAMYHAEYRKNSYIQANNIRSILCLPVLYQGKLHAILYLENKSVSDAFDKKRTHVLDILVAQLAISLQNARLHESLQLELKKHKETAENLLISEKRFRLSNKYSKVGSWEWDIVSGNVFWSDTISTMLGYKTDKLKVTINEFVECIFPDDREKVQQAIQKCFEGNVYRVEHRVMWPDGSVRWVEESGDVIRDEKGDPISMHGVIKDITDLKMEQKQRHDVERQLQQAQKMDALGNLTGGIAHDFNNVLGIILGYSELLADKLAEQPTLEKYARQILNASERGAKLTQKLLSITRKQSVEVVKLDINTLLREQQDLLQKTLTVRIELVLELDEKIWPICLDHSDLQDAILNISINAMYAMKDQESGARYTIRSCNVTLSRLEAKSLALEKGDYVQLAFIDTGCGMDDSTREKIFEPFFSTKGDKGTGLGLSQVYSFVRRAKGGIDVYSKSGHGSRFMLYFPRYIDNATTGSKLTHNYVDLTGTENILVVDDEEALTDLVADLLNEQGYTVFCAQNSQQALHIIEHESIDLMLSDVIMPEMNGFQLAAVVQDKYPSVIVQLVSGYVNEENMGFVNQEKHKQLIHKPYNSKVLLERIRSLLDNKKSDKEKLEK